MSDVYRLPEGLPVPEDDGACAPLPGKELPALSLRSTAGRAVDVAHASAARSVFFFYPRSGRPGEAIPEAWDRIPGARGCTPQSCAFRDRFGEFRERGVAVFGVSSQDTAWQHELAERTALPYELLSDRAYALTDALGLPTFVYEGERLIKRLTIVAERSRVLKVFYPVFPPDRNAGEVLDWLSGNPSR